MESPTTVALTVFDSKPRLRLFAEKLSGRKSGDVAVYVGELERRGASPLIGNWVLAS